MKDNNGRRAEAGPYQQNLFQGAQGHAAALIVGHVQNVVSQKGRVGGFALHDFAQRDGDLVLAAVAFAAVDVGFFGGIGHEALGEGQHLENGGLGTIPHGKGAGHFDVADHINLAAFRYADLLAAVQDDIQGRVGSIDEAFDQDALDEGGRGSVRAGLGAGDQDFGAGFRREAARASDGFEPGDRAGALESEGQLTAPATEMGWLLYSATVTVTNGSTIICSSCKALAIADSSSPGIRPCAFTRCLSIGRRTKPSALTRTVRVSSGASYTETAIRSLAPIAWAGRFAP